LVFAIAPSTNVRSSPAAAILLKIVAERPPSPDGSVGAAIAASSFPVAASQTPALLPSELTAT